jgi:hypothetical protein
MSYKRRIIVIGGANRGSQWLQTPPDWPRPRWTYVLVRGSPSDFLRPVQTVCPCLGVKGSRVQIPPSRHGTAGQRPFHRIGGVASRSFDRTLTAGFGGILRHVPLAECDGRHTPAVQP